VAEAALEQQQRDQRELSAHRLKLRRRERESGGQLSIDLGLMGVT
jgi:hypothetical protein